jgi:DNA replication licensing factor MCM5
MLPFFEAGAREALKNILRMSSAETAGKVTIPEFQVILKSAQLPQSLRNLTAEHVNMLVKIPGIVISCSKIRAKATQISIRCTKCGNVMVSVYYNSTPRPCKFTTKLINVCSLCLASLPWHQL